MAGASCSYLFWQLFIFACFSRAATISYKIHNYSLVSQSIGSYLSLSIFSLSSLSHPQVTIPALLIDSTGINTLTMPPSADQPDDIDIDVDIPDEIPDFSLGNPPSEDENAIIEAALAETESVSNLMSIGIHHGPSGLPNGISNGVNHGPNDVPNGLPNGIHHGPNGVPNGIHNGLDGVPNGLPNGLPNDRNGIHNGPNDVPNGISNDIANGIHNGPHGTPSDPDGIANDTLIPHEAQLQSRRNYAVWSTLVLAVLDDKNLRGYVDGSITEVPRPAEGVYNVDHEATTLYNNWAVNNSMARLIITSNIPQVMQSILSDLTSASDVWGSIGERFATGGISMPFTYIFTLKQLDYADCGGDIRRFIEAFSDLYVALAEEEAAPELWYACLFIEKLTAYYPTWTARVKPLLQKNRCPPLEELMFQAGLLREEV